GAQSRFRASGGREARRILRAAGSLRGRGWRLSTRSGTGQGGGNDERASSASTAAAIRTASASAPESVRGGSVGAGPAAPANPGGGTCRGHHRGGGPGAAGRRAAGHGRRGPVG